MSDQPPQYMRCMEVLGGSQLTAQGVEFGGLDAWVYSKPFGGAHSGGDVYYASSCATGRITRLLLADVAGHGKTAAATAADLRTLMRRFVNRLDQTEFVKLLNQQFAALSRTGVFATAVVITFFSPTRRLMLCNAGHPRPLLYRAAKHQWDFLGDVTFGNLPLGILELTEYQQFDVELEIGDCLVSYSDALIEAADADGQMLGEAGLLRVLRLLGDVSAEKLPAERLIDKLLKEIGDRYAKNLSEDDVTVMVVRANGRQAHFSLREKLGALGRFAASLAGAINPRAERPPLPDANVANIGGAIIPALARRWRSPRL